MFMLKGVEETAGTREEQKAQYDLMVTSADALLADTYNPALITEITPWLLKMKYMGQRGHYCGTQRGHFLYERHVFITLVVSAFTELDVALDVIKKAKLSRYITHNKAEYYSLIQAIRDKGTDNAEEWEAWILFMLKGVEETAGTREEQKAQYDLMVTSADALLADTYNPALITEITPWLLKMKYMGQRGQKMVEMWNNLEQNDAEIGRAHV